MTTDEQRERKREQDRAWYAAHREEKFAKVAAYRALYPERVHESNIRAQRKYEASGKRPLKRPEGS